MIERESEREREREKIAHEKNSRVTIEESLRISVKLFADCFVCCISLNAAIENGNCDRLWVSFKVRVH